MSDPLENKRRDARIESRRCACTGERVISRGASGLTYPVDCRAASRYFKKRYSTFLDISVNRRSPALSYSTYVDHTYIDKLRRR